MPLNQRNVPFPPDDDPNEDVMTTRGKRRLAAVPDPPGREDIMAPDPKDSRASR